MPPLVALAVFAWLWAQPAVAIEHARGLYRAEGGATPFRWTGSLAELPLAPGLGAAHLSLTLSTAGWPRQPQLPVRVEADTGPLATLMVEPQPRRFQLLLPPQAALLRLHTAVARPPGDDWRWLGVQLHAAQAIPSGLPARALGLAALAGLASVPLTLALRWAVRRGHGAIALLMLLGLGLRLYGLADAPPLMHRDEAVSLVDAWHLANTGRDHLGHLLPLAAFEGYGDWIAPLLTYLLLPWVALFGPQPLVARMVVAVCGALAIPVLYGLLRDMRQPVAALVAAAVAAISPWQIFLSRVAIPPALVALSWGLCLWAALRLVRDARRRDALTLALAAGLALYAYPPMKLAVPLLVALAVGLALWRHGLPAVGRQSAVDQTPADCRLPPSSNLWKAVLWRWWPAGLLLALLWLPFALSILLNPASGARLALVAIRADSTTSWLALWWANYQVYFLPTLYYGAGGLRKIVQGIPGHGLALAAEGFMLLGLGLVGARRWWEPKRFHKVWLAVDSRRSAVGGIAGDRQLSTVTLASWQSALLLGALLIAPLPASLTSGNPHAFRGALVAPLYALFAGLGSAALWQAARRWPAMRALAALALALVLAWQAAAWYYVLLRDHPAQSTATWFFADQELEAMRLVAGYAPQYDEVWLDTSSVGRPYIFLLAAQALPPAEAQAQIVVERDPPAINRVISLGRYQFTDFAPRNIPWDLGALEALPTRAGGPGYLLQVWEQAGRRILLVRGMTTQIANYADDEP